MLGGIVAFTLIVLAFNSIKGKLNRNDIVCELKIKMDSNSVYVKAIIDTGNFLKEPITGTPVIVVEKQELYGVIHDDILNNLTRDYMLREYRVFRTYAENTSYSL